MEKRKEIKLCSGSTWCPVLCFDGERVSIQDDEKNKASLSKENWNFLVDQIQNGSLGKIE